jgi:mediator of replication checkpoint protein 1
MSSPSTPSSSPLSPSGSTSDVLTPSRKLKALLAQFDDSDSDGSTAPRVTKKLDVAASQPAKPTHPSPLPATRSSSAASSEDDEDLAVARRGRLATRLDSPAELPEVLRRTSDAASSSRQQQLRQEKTTTKDSADHQSSGGSSEDELSRPAPIRKLLLKRKRSPASAPPSYAKSSGDELATPPLPAATPDSGVDRAEIDSRPEVSSIDGKSKFLALVEKHRKQRLAMEAAEITKRAIRVEQLDKVSKSSRTQRGSSVADSSGDDTVLSDEDAGLRLAKEVRPTRKASKKALEEMNRETQRMSRNMQLAHQAKTKKKITKESLLALFNFPVLGRYDPVNAGTKSLTASSTPASDAEVVKEYVTPPTSQIMGDDFPKDVSVQGNIHGEELLDLDEVMTQPITFVDKGKGRSIETLPGPSPEVERATQVRPIRVRWTKEDAVMARAADSDSDLEIITSRSKTRKYVVFEKMPSRKARETESHLVLRNLAHLSGDSRDKKRSSMNVAEMEISLRTAARLQAQRERADKIEELKAKGVVIQTSEEREREQQEVEDLVEKARQEGAEIQKREKEAAKKDGTFVKDSLDDDEDEDEDEEDGDFGDEEELVALSGSEGEQTSEGDLEGSEVDEILGDEVVEPEGDVDEAGLENENGLLVDDAADEQDSDNVSEDEDEQEQEQEQEQHSEDGLDDEESMPRRSTTTHKPRQRRVIVDDDDNDEEDEVTLKTPLVPAPAKTPQSLTHSARKVIPGFQMSDNLPIGLTQAFAATMADSQTPPSSPESQEQDSLAMMRGLPSPNIPFMPQIQRLDSLDVVSDSQPASQTQSLNLNFDDTQPIPRSPAVGIGVTGTPLMQSQMPFEPTQDAGYMLSPFAGSRFGADTPQQQEPQSTIDTVIVSEDSPLVRRNGRLRRGQAKHVVSDDEDIISGVEKTASAFEVMHRAAKNKLAVPEFDKTKSYAKDIVDEAAEESEDEYAGLGGASDDEVGEEDEDDRKMIDHDTQVGEGDEAKLAGLYADRERQQDEAAVSKLLKDITTGALRRKRGVGDDLDLSDEEDEAVRRLEAKRREYAKMRRELFKDEAVEKISEDKKKEAFLKSIEDRDEVEDEDEAYEQEDSQQHDSQSQQLQDRATEETQDADKLGIATASDLKRKRPLEPAHDSSINRLPPALRRGPLKTGIDKKPSTLAEIRDSVSFLIEEPDSQSTTIDLGLSDSEDEPEKYMDLDRHLRAVDEIEEDDGEDLGDFIVDDSQKDDTTFKVPELPGGARLPATERRTKSRNVVDRLSLMRQSSSSSTSSKTVGKMAFFTAKSSMVDMQFAKVPSLLRRATTNSSFGSMAGREESATRVTVTKERGHAGEEKTFVRKGSGGQRNAVNYRVKPAESKMSERAGVKKPIVGKSAKGNKGGFLGGLFRGDSWA